MIYLGDDVSTDSKTLIISSETNLIVGKKIKLVHRNFYQTSNNQLVLGSYSLTNWLFTLAFIHYISLISEATNFTSNWDSI